MSALEQFREAILRGEFSAAQALLAKLGGEQAADTLVWALQVARAQRAHDAARLGQLVRTSAYRPRNPESHSTWTLDA